MFKIISLRLILTLIISGFIPLMGLLGSYGLEKYHENKFTNTLIGLYEKSGASRSDIDESKLTLDSICWRLDDLRTSELYSALKYECELDRDLSDFEMYSSVYLVILTVVLFSVIILGWITRFNRLAHLIVFKSGTIIFTILICCSVIANAAILVAGSYFIPAYFVGYYLPKLTFILGLGAAYIVFLICKNSLWLLSSPALPVYGRRVYPAEHSKLWDEIRNISNLAGVQPPDNVIIGLEPNFFVTECKLNTLDGAVSGRSLFLSLSIMKSLSIDELKSIILHELGHFKGLDTMYSKYYSPIFKRVQNTQLLLGAAASANNSVGYLGALPTKSMIDFFNLSFLLSHQHHNRTRESSADDLAVKLTSAKIFSSALFKAISVGEFWDYANGKIVELSKENRMITNIPEYIKNVFNLFEPAKLREIIGKESQTHPFDSHPSLNDRIERYGISLDSISLDIEGANSLELLSESLKLEEELTNMRYFQLDRQGTISLNKSDS